MECDARGGARNPGRAPFKVGGRGSAPGDQNCRGTGCGVCSDWIPGVQKALTMERNEGRKSSDWRRSCVCVSGYGGNRTRACDAPLAIPLRARILEFPRNPCPPRSARQAEEYAGPTPLRRARIRAPAKNGARFTFGSRAGSAYDWMRKKHLDWHAQVVGEKSWKLGAACG